MSQDSVRHTLLCSKCSHPLGEQLVRALEGAFHPECFTCWDCNSPVASRYLPHPTEPGQPLCERDYFKRLGLVCEQCLEPLRGTYVIALDKKYHTDHFTCSDCSTIFGPEDSYYEHEGNVYCHFHYSTRFAVACAGCAMSILKQYVEIERNGLVEHWHPECYMIQKYWSVKIAYPTLNENEPPIVKEIIPQSPSELLTKQHEMEEKVVSIWSVLSAFEESSAVCISEMLLHVSNGAYIESICLSERFLVHVEALFAGIDRVHKIHLEYNQQEFKYTRDAKMLCKKIINFFSLLSRSGDMEKKKLGNTQELLSLVTGLAHSLKILIRLVLTAALRLEIIVDKPIATSHLLAKLMEIPGKERHSRDSQRLIKPKSTDFCHQCKMTIEDQCMRSGDTRWHLQCFKCKSCHRPLTKETAVFDANLLQCLSCAGVTCSPNSFEFVSKLSQYSFLLRIALSRLCHLLQITDNQLSSVDYTTKLKSTHLLKDANTGLVLSPSSEKQMMLNTNDKVFSYPTELEEAVPTQLDRKMSRSFKTAKRSTILGNANVTASLKAQEIAGRPARMDSLRRIDQHRELTDIPDNLAISTPPKSNVNHHVYIDTSMGRPRVYMSELSALQYMIVRYVAVVHIEQYVKSAFNATELLNLIETKKSSIWGKFFTGFKKPKNTKQTAKEEGTFGVPLDLLTERTGVESNLGSGHSPVKLAAFIDDAITAMRQMNMSVEGVFRKNGNIRRLKELTDAYDRNQNPDLTQENAIQVAALLKKFLRELPDPLLTYRLHSLFLCVEKLEDAYERKRALHLICCMLPRCNRETLEVLFIFFRWVATFSRVSDDVGSRMDIPNLARVLAPNILTSSSKDPLKDESFSTIRVVEMLLECHEEFCMVPEDIEMFLQDPSLSEIDISPREFLKRVEQTVKHKNFSPHSPEPRQFDNDKSSLYTNNRNPPHDFAPRRMESHESFYPREIAESINAP